jgi:hypothetical protein
MVPSRRRSPPPACHHEAGQYRPQFAGDAQRHDGGDQAFGIEARRAEIDLQRQRAAGEEGGEADHGQREIADAQHLLEHLADIAGGGEALDQAVADEQRDLARFLRAG